MHRAHSRRNNHFFVPDNTRSASPASCKFSSSPDRRLRPPPPAIPDTIPRILCPFFRRTFFRRPPFFYTHLTIPRFAPSPRHHPPVPPPPPLPPTVEQGEIELTWTRQFSIFLFPAGAMTFFSVSQLLDLRGWLLRRFQSDGSENIAGAISARRFCRYEPAVK